MGWLICWFLGRLKGRSEPWGDNPNAGHVLPPRGTLADCKRCGAPLVFRFGMMLVP